MNARSPVFFCFDGNEYDKGEAPNKIVLDKPQPTVFDLAVALKKAFKLQDSLYFRYGAGTQLDTLLPEDSAVAVPVNDRTNIVYVKIIETQHYAPQERTHLQALTDAGAHLTTAEGTSHKRSRQEEVDHGGAPLSAVLMSSTTGPDGVEGTSPLGKKLKVGRIKKPKLKLKDIDVLVNDERMPVHIGTLVYCGTVAANSGSNGTGVVVQYKDKAVIEYRINEETRHGSIAKFYKDVTGDPLQEKGPSWSNVFFKDTNTQRVFSLEGLKYLLNGPKKPVSAFLYFSNEARIKHKELKPDTFARLAGELWKKLVPDEKDPYRIAEQQDKDRFNKERMEWEAMTAKHSLNAARQPMNVQTDRVEAQGTIASVVEALQGVGVQVQDIAPQEGTQQIQ